MNRHIKTIIFFAILCTFVVGTTIIASSQEPEGRKSEVLDCDDWKYDINEGDLITFQHGIGFGDWDFAVEERKGEEAFFFLDGNQLSPVYYEGLTDHSPGFYGDRAWADWVAKPGEHTVQSYWSHEHEGYPGDTCTFKINKVPPPFASTPFQDVWHGIDTYDGSGIDLEFILEKTCESGDQSVGASLIYEDDYVTMLGCTEPKKGGYGRGQGTITENCTYFLTNESRWGCNEGGPSLGPYDYWVRYDPVTDTMEDSDKVVYHRKQLNTKKMILYGDDHNVGCSGTDDISTPVGEVTITPISGETVIKVKLNNAARNWHYGIAVAQVPQPGTCSVSQSFEDIFTDKQGKGKGGGVYTDPFVSDWLAVKLFSRSGIPPNMQHYEISTYRLIYIGVP